MFSDNSINGIISSMNGESKVGGYAGSAAAILITYGPENTATPQDLMNIFSGNTITGADFGLVLDDVANPPVPFVGTILAGNFFESDGSASSAEMRNLINDGSVFTQFGSDFWQGFWS